MPESAPPRRSWGALAFAITLFALGLAVATRFQLTHGVLYRAAANDWANAAETFVVLALQALALLAAIALLGRGLFVAAMALGGPAAGAMRLRGGSPACQPPNTRSSSRTMIGSVVSPVTMTVA